MLLHVLCPCITIYMGMYTFCCDSSVDNRDGTGDINVEFYTNYLCKYVGNTRNVHFLSIQNLSLFSDSCVFLLNVLLWKCLFSRNLELGINPGPCRRSIL